MRIYQLNPKIYCDDATVRQAMRPSAKTLKPFYGDKFRDRGDKKVVSYDKKVAKAAD